MTLKAIIFDLDDTLYLERHFVFSGYRAASDVVQARFGVAIADELTARFESGQRGDLFTPVIEALIGPIDERFIKKLVAVYRRHTPDIAIAEDASAALNDLSGNYQLGLITDGIGAVQKRKIRALGLEQRLDHITVSDDLGRENWKPSPLPYEACCANLGVSPQDSLFIGDNPRKDFVTARKLCMRTIRLRRPRGLYEGLEPAPGYQADVEIRSLNDLASLFPSLRQPEVLAK